MAKPKQDVETLREQIASVLAELDAIARAPIPLSEATENMGVLLDRAAMAYDPAVSVFSRDPDPQLDVLSILMPDPRWDAQAAWSFFAAVVDRGRLIALWAERLRRAYETDASLAHPIPLGERAGRLEAAQKRLRDLELAEEKLIVDLESRGVQVDRRDDADPAVLFADEMLADESSP